MNHLENTRIVTAILVTNRIKPQYFWKLNKNLEFFLAGPEEVTVQKWALWRSWKRREQHTDQCPRFLAWWGARP